MKKLFVILLTIALMLSASALAAVTPAADKTVVAAGETVNVAVSADEAFEGVYGMSYDLYYDETLFDYDYESSVAGDAIAGIQASVKGKTDKEGKKYVLIQYIDLTAQGQKVNVGTLYTLAFTAKTDLTEDTVAAFELKNAKVRDTNRQSIETDATSIPSDKAKINVSILLKTPEVTAVTLDASTLTVKKGGEATLTATVTADEGADKTVTWSSSDESVATVDENGKVTAVAVGRAVITAKAGELSAACNVTVENTAESGYTVKLAEDQTVNVGDEVTVRVYVGVGDNDTRTAYNAVDMQLSYDSSLLTYTAGTADSDSKILETETGTLKLVRYGSDAKLTDPLVTLKFTAKAAGEAKVSFVSAKVDESANASVQNAPEATWINDNVVITIGGYHVDLGDDFTGDATTKPGEDYTFNPADPDHYDYTDVKATIGGEEVPVTKNDDGSYTINKDDITGDITITGTKTGKEYSVTFDGTGAEDVTGESKANYGTDYTFTVDKKSGYTYQVSANVDVTDNGDGTYTIAGGKIDQAITVTVTKTQDTPTPPTPTTTTITITGVTASEVEGGLTHTAPNGQDYKITINKDAAYDYVVKIGDETLNANEDGTYTIPGSKLTGEAVTVTVEKTVAAPEVEVYEYLKLKEAEGETAGQSMWLVLVKGTPESGKVYAFDDSIMFTSEKYDGAFCYLMIAGDKIEDVKADAAKRVSQKEGTATAVTYDGNVNGTDITDINDAQLVYDMYQARYTEFTTQLAVVNFLRADVDGSKNITVKDAAVIVGMIHKEFAQ